MKLEEQIQERAENKCELCGSELSLKLYEVPPVEGSTIDNTILVCQKCANQLEQKEELDSKHWMCLSGSMWSEVPAVQVVSWRMLNRLRHESWAIDNLDMMYLDEETLSWAKSTGDHENDSAVEFHKDANGNILQTGDSVVLTRSLDVKGTSLNAKLGTVVKNIRIVEDNTDQIEGKIEGQMIVILTKYVRKQS